MKTNIFKIIKLIFIPVIMLFSCVPAKQFRELQDAQIKCTEQRDLLTNQNNDLTVQSTELASQIGVLKNELSKLITDSSKMSDDLKEIQINLDKVDRQYKDLQTAHDELLKGNAEEMKKLLKQLQTNQEDIQKREDQIRKMQTDLEAEKQNIAVLNQQLEDRNKRLIELEQILNKKDSAATILKQKITEALIGFEKNELSVTRREGKIYVSLEEKLLFKSGSYEVDPKGVTALKKFTKVLEQNPDINIMIEGHTDDRPYIPDAAIKDNWDLSVKRATSIVRILLNNSNIDPKRLTVAGRGEFLPVDPAKTPEARKKNRRTEIILTPNLKELYDIIESK